MLAILTPILFVSVGWFAHDPVSLLSSSILFLAVLILILSTKNFDWRISRYFIIPLLIPVAYLISAVINQQSLASLFLGGYQRNFGLATIISLSLIFILSSSPQVNVKNYLNFGLLLTLVFANVYGYLQYFGLDPLPWVNPYNAVSLTLGNPNFAGALYGLLSVITFSKIIHSKSRQSKLLFLLLFISSIFLAIQTKSLQALLLVGLSTFIYLLIISIGEQKPIFKLTKYASVFFVAGGIFSTISIFGFGQFSAVRERIFFQGSIPQRLDYWQNGLDIWRDHLFFGVGVDQFQRYAALYRSSSQIVRDGNFVIPDKSHNVLIDHLANGGLLAAGLWIAFVISIFVIIIKLSKQRSSSKNEIAILAAIWSAYIGQSFISPDQIILAVIGYSAAGILLGIYIREIKKSTKSDLKSSENPFLIRATAGTLLVVSFFIYAKALSANAQAKQMVAGNIIGAPAYLEVINSWPYPKTTELIGIEALKDPNNCSLVEEISGKLIAMDNRSAQGWFMKAVCANLKKDFISAISYAENSLKFDPLNPFYLLSKAKLEFAANKIDEAQISLDLAKSINPNEPDLTAVEASIQAQKDSSKK